MTRETLTALIQHRSASGAPRVQSRALVPAFGALALGLALAARLLFVLILAAATLPWLGREQITPN